MLFPRPKKVMFTNNKGGVGKTTLAFHVGVELSRKGCRVAFLDLEPPRNNTVESLGHKFYENDLFSSERKTIHDVLLPKLSGTGDLDLSVDLVNVRNRENLYILPGDIKLSLFENLLQTSYYQATGGNLRGYSDTSAIDRYLNEVGLKHKIDVFIIDTSPSLGILNRVIFLGSEYFVVPMTPDSFSVQGINNLGTVFDEWKRQWKSTARAMAVAGSTPANQVLAGDALFVGYIINSFNVYSQRKLRRQDDWIKKIPSEVKTSLSEKHGRNGLVEKSWTSPLGEFQDMGQLTAISLENNLAIQEFTPGQIKELNLEGSKQLHEKAETEISAMTDNLLRILQAY